MNLLEKLSIIKMVHHVSMLVPFVFIEAPDSVEIKMVGIPLQFDAPEMSGHVRCQIDDYFRAPRKSVQWIGEELEIPLIQAYQNKPTDVLIECEFGGGKLWGWFLKDFA